MAGPVAVVVRVVVGAEVVAAEEEIAEEVVAAEGVAGVEEGEEGAEVEVEVEGVAVSVLLSWCDYSLTHY